jgi:protein-S-isoprenylcysteine O-methyltransferase Ste14
MNPSAGMPMNHLSSPGFGIYVAHVAFWIAFVVARLIARASPREKQDVAPGTARATEQDSAPYSRLLVSFHMVGFGILYFGIGGAVFGGRPLALFESQRLAGSIVIGCGAALSCWALLYFRSWRFRAQLDVGHELATGGPYRFLRHPIYMALNLLALGSALWIPTLSVWVGFVFMVVGSDLRARSEEALLVRSFGERYASYCSRTRRFVPLLY